MSDQNNGGRDGYYDLLDSYSGLSGSRKTQSPVSSSSRGSENPSYNNVPSGGNADRSTGMNGEYVRRPVQDRSVGGYQPTRPVQDRSVGGYQPTCPVQDRPVGGYQPTRPVQDRPVGGYQPTRPVQDRPVGGYQPTRPVQDRPVGGSSAGRDYGAQRPASRPQSASPARRQSSSPSSSGKKLTKKQKRRRRRIKDTTQSLLVVFIVIIVVVLASLMLKSPIMGCIGDLVGIDRSANEMRVNIEEGMQVDDIIDLLKEKDLIFSSRFCKFATDFLKYNKTKKYTAGTYDLSPNMGIETMLNTIISAGETKNTVKLTFPEGLSLDQIVDKLVENYVCTAEKLYAAMEDEELFETYSFLEEIRDSEGRARKLEGYLAPDTYEFYLGEDPKSVLTKFLDNFKNRWEDEYSDRASELGLTVDQIVTVASILEKEANDEDQMKVIASILYNRRNSPYFSYINCDSTQYYVESFRDKVDASVFETISANYDTYKVTGFPKGAICNPGVSAIEAALYPDSTDYYYFLHDAKGNMYVARTEAEHNSNMQYLD